MSKIIGAVCLGAMLIGTAFLAFAGEPKGLEKQGKIPHGFTQGKKTGWQNEYPPGWDQKSEKEKQNWKDTVQKGRDNVSKSAKEKGMMEEEIKSVADDFEKAARKGIDPVESESIVIAKIKEGLKGKDLSDSVSEETKKRLEEKAKDKGQGQGKGKAEKE